MRLYLFIPAILLLSCTTPGHEPLRSMTEQARIIADTHLLLDTHIDAPLFMRREGRDISQLTSGQFDYYKARAGGLNLAFMSIYIPASIDAKGGGRAMADELIDLVENTIQSAPSKFVQVASTNQVRRYLQTDKAMLAKGMGPGRVMLAMGMENGGALDANLDNLDHFYKRGIRYITLAHSKSNQISDSSYDENRRWHGLSDFGKRLIPAMNAIGMMVDVSHISDEAFYQVIELSSAPVVATHSSARHFTPGFERNLDDEMIAAIARHGGVVQVTFGSGFISEASRQDGALRTASIRQQLAEEGLSPDSDTGVARRRQLAAAWDYQYASLDDLLDHFDYVRDLTGIDHLGFGSDFDGVGQSLPSGIKNASDYPNLIEGLLKRGYTEADLQKIMGGNLMRVWSEVERVSRQ